MQTKVLLNASIDASVMDDIDKLSKKLHLNRSQMVNNLLIASLSDAKLLENLGLFRLLDAVRRFDNASNNLNFYTKLVFER